MRSLLSFRPILGAIIRAGSVLPTTALAVALIALPVAASAQTETDKAEDNPVVARVNGEDIHRSAVLELAQTLPPQYQSQIAQVYPMLAC